jgi:hypothetical protein
MSKFINSLLRFFLITFSLFIISFSGFAGLSCMNLQNTTLSGQVSGKSAQGTITIKISQMAPWGSNNAYTINGSISLLINGENRPNITMSQSACQENSNGIIYLNFHGISSTNSSTGMTNNWDPTSPLQSLTNVYLSGDVTIDGGDLGGVGGNFNQQ